MLAWLREALWTLWDKGLYIAFAGIIALALMWKAVCEAYGAVEKAEEEED